MTTSAMHAPRFVAVTYDGECVEADNELAVVLDALAKTFDADAPEELAIWRDGEVIVAVQKADGPDREWATAADFDSSASEYTDWYQRTDENGRPVDYDWGTGTFPAQEDEPRSPDADGSSVEGRPEAGPGEDQPEKR